MAEEARQRRDGFFSDPAAGGRCAQKLPLLEKLAFVLDLELRDVLEPRIFSPEDHEWVRAHARVRQAKEEGQQPQERRLAAEMREASRGAARVQPAADAVGGREGRAGDPLRDAHI